MADDNQQPENNEPLENNQWEEKEWQAKMDYAKEVLARQQAEADQTRATAARQKEEREDAEPEGPPEDQEAEWAARLALAKGVSRTGARKNAEAPEDDQPAGIIKQLDVLDKKIADLNKKTSGDYIMPYLILTTGAATVDVLQAVADASLILALLASGAGVTFSIFRHYGLKYANQGASSAEHAQMFRRTLIYGAVSMIPFVDILPELTAGMLREWTIKKESITAANNDIAKLRAERKKLAASLK
jgi:hypothetical protein